MKPFLFSRVRRAIKTKPNRIYIYIRGDEETSRMRRRSATSKEAFIVCMEWTAMHIIDSEAEGAILEEKNDTGTL